jgi:hypothetical protein
MADRETPNLVMLRDVARRLELLLPRLAFLGGVVVDLFVTEPTARLGRATKDVDVIVDGRESLVAEFEATPPEVRAFVAAAWRDLLQTGNVPALLEAHLAPDEASQARAGLVLSRIVAMSRLG